MLCHSAIVTAIYAVHVECVHPTRASNIRMCCGIPVRRERSGWLSICTLLLPMLRGLDAIAGFDDIGLEVDGSRAAV